MGWDLKVLKQKVKEAHGEQQVQKLVPCLNSVAERQEFARFHFQQAIDAIGCYLDGNMKEGDLLLLFLSSETSENQKFITNRIKAKAHIHACLQNMHCVSDTIGHVIYFSLALNNAKKESHISLKNVCDWINRKSQYRLLSELLYKLISSDNCKYLEAIVNHSKHRSIIETEIVINCRPEDPLTAFNFKSFDHKNKHYGKRPIRQYLEEEYWRQSDLIVAIGKEINSLV